MADRTALQLATLVHHHLTALEALEAETAKAAADFPPEVAAQVKNAFIHLRQAHKHFNMAAARVPEISPQFGSK